jgi:hypothetical protein
MMDGQGLAIVVDKNWYLQLSISVSQSVESTKDGQN